MIVVFAQEHDEYAKNLVRRWRDRGARLMVPGDLSRSGWYCSSQNPEDSRCVIEGTPYPSSEIRGVLVRLPAVLATDLPHIMISDRDYVASEMTAFVVYWLNALSRPVLNRPTPRSLLGPGWFPEHWVYYAAQAGMRVRSMGRVIRLASSEPPAWPEHDGSFSELTVVAGAHCFGDVAPGLAEKGRALAAAAHVDLVKFRFDGPDSDACFLAADLCPPLDDCGIEQAVLDYFG
jgi:hypothetical protein